MDKTTDAKIPNGWRLRPATCDIVTGLHALVSMPMVYRDPFDGEAPDKELIANRIVWPAKKSISATSSVMLTVAIAPA